MKPTIIARCRSTELTQRPFTPPLNRHSQLKIWLSGWGATLALAGALVQAAPLGTAFSYQGRLADDGNAAQGTYDLRFTLYDAASAGTQVGPALTNGAVPVTGGLFTATVDFGTSAFTGEQRWLEIAVRTNGGGAFVALNPRQPLLATPHSLYAAGAGRATLATTATTANSVSAGNIAGTISLAQLPGVLLTNNQNGVALSGTFSGNGSALTGLSAANISSGSLADARLSANVALLSGSPTFAGPLTAPSFSGSGAGLTGLDSWQLTGPLTVSTSAIPIRVGGCATPGTAFGIVMSGNYAYVADGPQGLQVIDISNPANPQRVGGYNTTGQAWDVAVSGNFAYVADESAGLQVIDISNPANPQRVGGYGTASYLKGVAVAGNYAYVADGETGLRVLNISSPANPQLVGGYNSDGWAYGVTVSGNYAFLADGYEGLQVMDISNPANPQRIGGYNTTGFAARIALAGSYACVADYDGGLQVIDVSNPANPQRVGGCDTVGTAWNVAVAGNYAYVADAEAGLQVIDITKPSDPRSLGAYHSALNCYAVALRTDYAYLASGGLQVLALNATAAAAPAFQGDGSRLTSLDASQLTTGTLAESRVDSTLARDNEVFPLVLAQDGPNSGLDADLLDGLNSSDFAAATHSHDAKDINSGTLSDARLSPNVALLSGPASFTGAVTAPSFRGNASSLTDLDSRQLAGPLTITTSTAPVKLGGCDQASGYGVVVAGNYAYVAGGQAGLHVVDVSNPVNPQRVGGFDTPGKAWGVALAGNYAYIADEEAGLQVIDISNPANPQRVGGYDTPGYAKGVAVAGSYAYVADGETGLQVLDISKPRQSATRWRI